jgi:ribosomal protein S18 acetylase RimI-like enzyme
MRTEAYPAFFEEAVSFYAAENVKGGCWRAEDALGLSRAETEHMLAQGLETPDQYLFEILAADEEEPVGYVWLAALPRGTVKAAFVVQLSIKSRFRRQGHARAALGLIEQRARELGLSGMELHVFAHNPGARALYESVGYKASSTNMIKSFAENGAQERGR